MIGAAEALLYGAPHPRELRPARNIPDPHHRARKRLVRLQGPLLPSRRGRGNAAAPADFPLPYTKRCNISYIIRCSARYMVRKESR
jgi:hypothetical protein